MPATLPKISKRYANTLFGGLGGRQKRECWGARTVDDEWDIERQDEPGTPWIITHVPSGRVVPVVLGSRVDGKWVQRAVGEQQYGSLRKALVAIADGDAMRALQVPHE